MYFTIFYQKNDGSRTKVRISDNNHARRGYFGFYQRSAAFGGSASVSSVCLIVLACLIEINGHKLKFFELGILLITILLLINTTGIIIFVLYLILRRE